MPKSDVPPPNAGAGGFSLVAGAGAEAAKGLLPAEVKLKPVEDGGWGLKAVVLCAPAAKAGKDALAKLVLGAAGCAGGKLLVAPGPKVELAPPKPLKELAALSVGAGEPKADG